MKKNRLRLFSLSLFVCVLALAGISASTETRPLSQQMADATIQRWPQGHFSPEHSQWKWDYNLGTLLQGMTAVWQNSANPADFDYIRRCVDQYLTPQGAIPTYHADTYMLDQLLMGRQALLLYRVTQEPKYYKAATELRQQLSTHPRTASGGFWHQQQYPNQMWLDGIYMAEPFYAEYAATFQEPQDFADITRQFALLDQHARDPKTGLLYHAWDESKKERWANSTTGDSPNFWARGTGWYMMALVDTLPYYPQGDPGRATLLAILNRTAAAVAKVQDPATGLWYQVLDQPGRKGNYLESSAAGMFTYTFAKAVRLGYLPASYATNAARGYQGILQHFVQIEKDGLPTIGKTVYGIGLGGDPYSDGSFDYYVGTRTLSSDPRGIGAFLLAASEMEIAPHTLAGQGSTVLMDAWFNGQQRTNAAGHEESFHYKWNDMSNSGFSTLGHVFRSYGVSTATLDRAPTLQNLKQAQFYIIASPDIPSKNPHPNYVQPKDVNEVAAWVKQGGVLVLMENDPANADFEHFNQMADRFGLHFNNVVANHVVGEDIGSGRLAVSGSTPVFPGSHIFYMKDTCTLSVKGTAVPLVRNGENIMMATVKYGRGTVFAVVDPWLYNEYTDGHNRNLPPIYDNLFGANSLVRWLVQQSPASGRVAAR